MLLEVDFNILTVRSVKSGISGIADSDKTYTLISKNDYITKDRYDKGLECVYKISEESTGTASFAFPLSEIKTNCA